MTAKKPAKKPAKREADRDFSAAPTYEEAARASKGLVCTVVGSHTVDGVKPGGKLTLTDRDRVRYLQRAGHISCPLTDGDLVALTEAGL